MIQISLLNPSQNTSRPLRLSIWVAELVHLLSPKCRSTYLKAAATATDNLIFPLLISCLYFLTPSLLPLYISPISIKQNTHTFPSTTNHFLPFTFHQNTHLTHFQESNFHLKEENPSFKNQILAKLMETVLAQEDGLNLKATELRLGLPGTDDQSDKETITTFKNNKRSSPDTNESSESKANSEAKLASKAQVVGWPPIRNYRKNSIQQKKSEPETGYYVKVSMDGAPYLRKIDLKGYKGYSDLLKALENMFRLTIGEYSEREGYKGSEFAPTYEDKDGDWMLVGDVPWEMFSSSCKRLRIMKASEARGLGCGV